MRRMRKQFWGFNFFYIIIVLGLFYLTQNAVAMTDEDCLDCHTDPDLTVEIDGKTVQLTVDEEKFKGSVHADNGCVSCHEDADVEEAPQERHEGERLGSLLDAKQVHRDEGEGVEERVAGHEENPRPHR